MLIRFARQLASLFASRPARSASSDQVELARAFKLSLARPLALLACRRTKLLGAIN